MLGVPRLGTLNANMGILPFHRGMNVAEWAPLEGRTVGCSVFWLDEGIDTGPLIATADVDVSSCRSIDELRDRVDDAQLLLLDETLRSIVERGLAPAGVPQRGEGRQYFAMRTLKLRPEPI